MSDIKIRRVYEDRDKEIQRIAEMDCTCDTSDKFYEECPSCRAKAAMNEAGAILDEAIIEITGMRHWEVEEP